MKFNEATTPYVAPEVEYGLMTRDEFLEDRNEGDKYHSSDSFQSTVAQLNKDWGKQRIFDDPYGYQNLRLSFNVIEKCKEGYLFYQKKELIAAVLENTLYYTSRFNLKDFPFSYENGRGDLYNIEADNRMQVKYFDEVLANTDTPAKTNKDEYPKLLQRIKVGEQSFVVRMSDTSIVIMNTEGLVIAQASDEWGATLIRVATEYRNEGLGKIVGNYWYEHFPHNKSGGFTSAGQKNALNIWADRVRKMVQNGWYSELIKDGKVSKQKVSEILKGLPAKGEKKASKLKATGKPDILIYSDDTMFYIYDKKFFEEPVEKYVYAHGFFRESSGKIFIYSLDYDRRFQKLANAIILQIARDKGDKLYTKGPADFIEPEGLPVSIVDDHIQLDKDMLNMKDVNIVERAYRKDKDPYKEIFYTLQELADSKW